MDVNKSVDRGSVPLIILPGLLCDSRMFGAQISAFGAHVVDGFYDGSDRIEAMAEHALSCMPARCAVLGHSMGARVALEIWSKAPGRVERIALADTGVHPVRAGERESRYSLRDLGRRAGDAALVDAWLPPMVGPSHRHDDELMATLREMAMDAGVATFSRQIEALLHRPPAQHLLPTLTCPVLVIAGEEDSWSPPAQHESIACQIPGAQLRIVSGAGHMAPVEEPARFNDFVREWLDRSQVVLS